MKMNTQINKKSKQGGFTLVEIAIVLVIIGLILGGVLQGQSMIENAKYKKFEKEIDGYRAAFYTFQDVYQALPGDMSNITALNASANAGNGNGTINGTACSGTDESCRVWSHLRYADLIHGDPTVDGTASRPTHPFGGLVSGMETSGAGNGTTENKLRLLNVPGEIAQRYDNKYDDNDATSGDVARAGGSGATYGTGNVTLVIKL